MSIQQTADRLGLKLSAAQTELLAAYLAMLLRWNRSYNLTALREPSQMLSHHLADCLAVLPALERMADARRLWRVDEGGGAVDGSNTGGDVGDGAEGGGVNDGGNARRRLRILDVGSGAGLPGLVLAICRPEWQVVCVDAVAKKAGFIQQVAAELGLNQVRAVHQRVETLFRPSARPMEKFSLVTSRAFAALGDFVALTRDALAPGGVWMAMKGQHPAEELAALPPAVQVFHVEQLEVTGLDAQRCLVWMAPQPTPLAPPMHRPED